MRHHVRHTVLTVFVAAIALTAYAHRVVLRDTWAAWYRPPAPVAVPFVPQQEAPNPDAVLPKSFNLAVPFTPQAPTANWDAFHEDACEEASVYMVHRFYEGAEGRLPAGTVEAELTRMAAFEDKAFGSNRDTTAAQTGEIAKQLYGYAKVEVLKDPTVDQLKRELFAGRPVIVPMAGQHLGNPYFTPPGPDYHMLVLRGWTPEGFVTNDPGTRRGENLVYPYDVFMNAIHDWNGGTEDILKAPRTVLVVHPNE